MRLIVIMDWDDDTRHCQAETHTRHFLDGTYAEGDDPLECLQELWNAWEQRDLHHAQVAVYDQADADD